MRYAKCRRFHFTKPSQNAGVYGRVRGHAGPDVMYIRPAADYTQEELTRLVTESELKKYYGSRLSISAVQQADICYDYQIKFQDGLWMSSAAPLTAVGRMTAALSLHPLKRSARLQESRLITRLKSRLKLPWSEETNEHLEESSEIVKLLLVLKNSTGKWRHL